jgi:gamma-polyglutamate biosynthesis protein CapA
MKLLAILLIGMGIVFFLLKEQPRTAEFKPAVAIRKSLVTILFVGDVMFDRGVRNSIEKNFSGNYHTLYANAPYIQEADIAFANLEGPVAMSGHKVGSAFSFRMDPLGLSAMKEAGFDIVSFANNHVGDYTNAAFSETLTRLNESNILYAGAGTTYAEATTPRIVTVRGMRIGFLAATDVGPTWMKAGEAKPGILLADDPNMASIVAKAKEACDILVLSFHWGNEYSPKNERQEKLAHLVIDNGADIVVGHHPHVMEEVELYNGKPIFYSLGNFIFDQYFSMHTLRGMVAKVYIDADTKEIRTEQFVSVQNRQFIPQPLIPFSEDLLITKTFTP